MLLGKMRDTTREMCGRVQHQFSVSGGRRSKLLPPMFTRHVFLVFREAVNNALAHGRATTIQVFVMCHEGLLNVKVSDDGPGFNPLKVKDGDGLANMRRRAATLDGALKVDSSPGKGTVVTLQVALP